MGEDDGTFDFNALMGIPEDEEPIIRRGKAPNRVIYRGSDYRSKSIDVGRTKRVAAIANARSKGEAEALSSEAFLQGLENIDVDDLHDIDLAKVSQVEDEYNDKELFEEAGVDFDSRVEVRKTQSLRHPDKVDNSYIPKGGVNKFDKEMASADIQPLEKKKEYGTGIGFGDAQTGKKAKSPQSKLKEDRKYLEQKVEANLKSGKYDNFITRAASLGFNEEQIFDRLIEYENKNS